MEKVKSSQIIILHGWTFDVGKWNAFAHELSKLSMSTKILDLPGLTAPLDEVWTLDDFVSWLDKKLVDKNKLILLGHSFGGQIAAKFTASYPDRVSKLILIASAGIKDNSIGKRLKRFVFLILAKLGKILVPFESFRKLLYFLARETDYYKAPPMLRKTMSIILKDEVTRDLAKIKALTCIIWGREDSITPVSSALLFHNKIKKSELHVLDNAKHSPQFTHPGKVAEIVKEFLK